MKHRLMREGKPIVNTPMLGAFAKASNLVSLEAMEQGMKSKLSGAAFTANVAALRDAYEHTVIKTCS
jgi:Pyruvate/2-oxoacid:ferredoxin oxidoreductase gamma subunit